MEVDHYVVVGSNVVMAKDTYNNYILFGVIFVVVLIFFLIFMMFYIQLTSPQIIPKPIEKYVPLAQIESINTTFGSTDAERFQSSTDGISFLNATSCNAAPNSEWNIELNRCDCLSPYWGPSCERISYDNRYISAGIYNPNIIQTIMPPDTVDTGPFLTLRECTDACLNNLTCSGVIWKSPLLPDDCTEYKQLIVKEGKTIEYPLSVNEDIYVQNRYIENLRDIDKVFLFSGTLPIRHWLRTLYTSPESNQITIVLAITYLLPFFPTGYINGRGAVGIYSLDPFTLAEYNALLAGGDTDRVYIHYPNLPLAIPPLWSRSNIWVMYG